MRIIGLCGKKGVGKNFVCDQLTSVVGDLGRNLGGAMVETAAFADPFKKFLSEAFGIDQKLLYGSDKDKNNKTQYDWEKLPEFIRTKFGNPTGKLTIREFMQVFGTEICRDMFDSNIWVNAMGRKLKNSSADWFIITDVRFPHEVALVKESGGQVWNVDGPQRGDEFAQKDGHSSETSLHSGVQYDIVIQNGWDDSKESVRAKVREALKL